MSARRARRALAAGVGAASVLIWTAQPARAEDKQVCLTSYVEAQKSRLHGALGRAAEELARCGESRCPAAVRDDCVRWLAEVQAATPSVVLSFTDGQGRDRGDVTVRIDGKLRATSLEGRALALDPGAHDFVLRSAEGVEIVQRLVVREGEHDRRIAFVAPAAQAHGTVARSRPVPTAVWPLVGVGAAGVATWAGFGLAALYAHPGLESTLSACKPSCPASDVHTVRTRFLVADVAAGVGLASLAGAAYLFFTRPEKPAIAGPLALDVTLSPAGGGGRFAWTF
jgi:hypothetical protein